MYLPSQHNPQHGVQLLQGEYMKKSKRKEKNRSACCLCDCTQAPNLSNKAAAQINTFLEMLLTNFQNRYGQRILDHYAKRPRENVNETKPWLSAGCDESF